MRSCILRWLCADDRHDPDLYEANLVTSVCCIESPAQGQYKRARQKAIAYQLKPGTLVIQASTNVGGGWASVFTNTTPTNVLFYSDTNAGSYPTRFYRAYQSP